MIGTFVFRYVLRRILRRAVWFAMTKLNANPGMLGSLVDTVVLILVSLKSRPGLVYPESRPGLVYPRLQRQSNRPGRPLRAGLLNIRSVNNKTENVPDLFEEHRLNLLILTETWHEDADSVAIKRLRNMGLNVIEAARAIPTNT